MYDTVIDFSTVGGVTVATIACDLDIANAATIGRYLDEALGASTSLVVSLAGCAYLDSSGLRPLVDLARRLGDGFSVVVPSGTRARRVFDIVAPHTHIAVRASLDDALAHVTRGLTAA
ncbi:MAG: hypothetical protein NVSMB21_18640 [Vulcanimicrobiaceae bacterium]